MAILWFFEFNPIHMPNQHRAARLATNVSVPATEIASITKSFGAAKPPNETVVAAPPVVTVATDVEFVVRTVVLVVVVTVPHDVADAFFFQMLYETAPDAANQLAKPVVGDVPWAEKLAGGSHAGPPVVKIAPTK